MSEYPTSPGQVVSVQSRCPATVRTVIGVPAGKRSLPRDVNDVVAPAPRSIESRWARKAMSSTTESCIAGGGGTRAKSPIMQMSWAYP